MGLVSRAFFIILLNNPFSTPLAPMPLSPRNALRDALSVPTRPLFRGSLVVGVGSPLRELFTHLALWKAAGI